MTPDFAILFLDDCSGMAHLRPWRNGLQVREQASKTKKKK